MTGTVGTARETVARERARMVTVLMLNIIVTVFVIG